MWLMCDPPPSYRYSWTSLPELVTCATCSHKLASWKEDWMARKSVGGGQSKSAQEGAIAAAREVILKMKPKSKSEERRLAIQATPPAPKGKPTERGLGWNPQRPDHRDKVFPLLSLPMGLPKRYDMGPGMPPVYDQGRLGSCTANAATAAVQYTEQELTGKSRPSMSRLYTYYWTRFIEGHTGTDSGATIRDTFKSLNRYGYCFEKLWPYTNRFVDAPSVAAMAQADKHHLLTQVNYSSVPQQLGALRQVLAAGHPIVYGFTVYESFMSAQVRTTGLVPLPGKHEKVLGGHAVCLVGYDDDAEDFIVRNSWGRSWGQDGYCRVPYAFILNQGLCTDFWTVQSVPAVAEETA